MTKKLKPGYYIVIEGPEGVGKTTQVDLLMDRLRKEGHLVRQFREPESQAELTARAIRTITQDPNFPMNSKTEVLLYNAARSQSLEVVKRAKKQGMFCVTDRSYLTTLAIQFYARGDIKSYDEINHIIDFAVDDMYPDLMIVLDAPTNVLHERLQNRYEGGRFDKLNVSFLKKVREGYLKEATLRNIPVVSADGEIEQTAKEIWRHVANMLKDPDKYKQHPLKLTSDVVGIEPPVSAKEYVTKNENGSYSITPAGEEFLKGAVTDTKGPIYAFTDKLSNITVAAAMARLSRRGDDMRVTILDEFASQAGKDADLLKRVITAYGDDSVQQLAGIHMVVEGASNLLTKKLEWGRLASYLEQSTRYIYFDQKDAKGNYRYYTPSNLQAKTAINFEKTMDTIFNIYSDMVRNLTDYIRDSSTTPKDERDVAWKGATRAQACDAIRPVLPVATRSTVGIFASGQAIESLIMHLQGDELQEAKATGDALLKEARKVMPVFLERADRPDRGGATVAYHATNAKKVRKLAQKELPQELSPPSDTVELIDVWPRNELDLVPHMLYEHSNLPLERIREEVGKWDYERKAKVFKTYIGERLNRRHKPGRALEQAHYSWDLVCDYGIFRDLQRHRMVDDLRWQELTPRYGYDMPLLVEEAGLSEQFERCFDLSYQLYSEMQADGYQLEAQYATLLGHRMRWKVMFNAREAFHWLELRTSPQGHPGYRKLSQDMYEKVAEVHPMLGEAMIFVNQGEDPELTRLAAERYTQFKLQELDKKKS